MSVHDDEFMDSIAVLALGALPESEARELATHVAGCATCRRAYDELRGAANLVGYAAESRANELDEVSSARMKTAIMRSVRPARAQRRPVLAWLGFAAAAAAIVFAVRTASNDAALRAQHERDGERIAALQRSEHARAADVAAADARIAVLLAPGSKRFAVPGGSVVTSGGRVYFALRHLPAPPRGKVYQAWTLARGKKAVAPSITFEPRAGAMTVIELPERAAGLAAVALSVEPAGGSKAPTSKPTFVRPLS